MDPFLEKFFPDVYAGMKDSRTSNYCMFDSQLLTAFTASLYIAGFFASLCASKVTQAFGRRASMLLGGAAFLVGAVLGGLAVNVFMLILGRVLLGIGVGFTNQAYFTGSVLPSSASWASLPSFTSSSSCSLLLCTYRKWLHQNTEEQSTMDSTSLLDSEYCRPT
ncbi:hypothetical protein GW17_00021984 [Ensete ventricosum]|nr:hypothetical protein GW17_00021984 [Ensete ventricosum]